MIIRDKNLSSRFEKRFVIECDCLSNAVQSGNELIKLVTGVVLGEPQRLAIIRNVITSNTTVVLLLSLIDYWDTIGEHGERDYVLN